MMEFDINHLKISESTNDDAVALAMQGAAEGTVVIADEQSIGVGRRGKTWISPVGNLYFSLILRNNLYIPALSFISSIAAGQALEYILGLHITSNEHMPTLHYKWPNDVLVNGKKISGVLLRTQSGQQQNLDWVVCGIGVNILSSPEYATSLRDYIPDIQLSNVELMDLILQNFAKLLDTYANNGFAPLRNLWLKKAYNMDQEITVATSSNTSYSGKFVNIDLQGSMLLERDNQIIKIEYGEIV